MNDKGVLKIKCRCGHKFRVELGPESTRFKCPQCGFSTLLSTYRKALEKGLAGKKGEGNQNTASLAAPASRIKATRDLYLRVSSRGEAEALASDAIAGVIGNLKVLITGGNNDGAAVLLANAMLEAKPGTADVPLLEYFMGMAEYRSGNFAQAEGHFKQAAEAFPNWETPAEAAEECKRKISGD
jgi:DNA-directed RNA polymerase subunit RPC12/RpoP